MSFFKKVAWASLVFLAEPALGKDIVVRMKNQGVGGMMVFEPAYVSAAVGDAVHFVPTDKGHNAVPITGMWPEGVDAPVRITDGDYVLKLTKSGLYGIKCTPHFPMGMVALLKVGIGKMPNSAAVGAVRLPPLAAKRMMPMLALAGR
jgi:pseudoazurin